MPSRKQSRLAETRTYAAGQGIDRIDEQHFSQLLARFAPISDAALRKLLRETGLRLAPVVEGVRQDDPDQLERTLVALTGEYLAASGDRDRTRRIRAMVITAKEHARFAARRPSDDSRRRLKEEMAEWILIWLENPAIFPQWIRLRRGAIRPD